MVLQYHTSLCSPQQKLGCSTSLLSESELLSVLSFPRSTAASSNRYAQARRESLWFWLAQQVSAAPAWFDHWKVLSRYTQWGSSSSSLLSNSWVRALVVVAAFALLVLQMGAGCVIGRPLCLSGVRSKLLMVFPEQKPNFSLFCLLSYYSTYHCCCWRDSLINNPEWVQGLVVEKMTGDLHWIESDFIA